MSRGAAVRGNASKANIWWWMQKPCLDGLLLESSCDDADLDCLCPLAWGSPVLDGCTMQSCDIAQSLGMPDPQQSRGLPSFED